jgi:hypothetical protein
MKFINLNSGSAPGGYSYVQISELGMHFRIGLKKYTYPDTKEFKTFIGSRTR